MKIEKYYVHGKLVDCWRTSPEEAQKYYKVPFVSNTDDIIVYLSPTKFSTSKNSWGFYGWDDFNIVNSIPEEIYNSPLFKLMQEID